MNQINRIILGLLIVSSVLLSACQKEVPKTEEIPYVMVTQPSSNHVDQKSYAGDVQARQQTALAFRVGGQITERYVDVGDRVKVGQVLAKLDVKDAQLQMNAAKAQLDSAQAAAKIAAEEYQRYQQLLPVNAVSRSQFDAVKNQYESAQASLQQARSNYEVSSNQTGYNRLVSNKNGVITQRQIEIGQVIAAGQAVYQLAIDGEREVVFGVPEQSVSTIKVGQPVWVTLWSQPDARFAAKVREVSPAADQSRTFTVKVSLLEGQSTIQLGQSARVFFVANENNVLSVPLSSVTANDQQAYVWVVNANQSIRKVPVTLGSYGRDSVPVVSGLKATDWVVVGGVHLLRDQQKIHPVDRDNREVTVKAGG
ncbi:efflux RND transporter periplasmic adaptor subunit [Acinetobacter sp. C26M]|uniref:efflux RND transporter periplasmic adaptor subunit n=1 Tax=unclassified Acinetobacter TaxID=196816 RepID=UPI00141DC570|nr:MULTISPECIES: efflux RND transporter periplasmic adaptor subunit [unclassified Acinetobacter]NIE96321.1 efflux RND transporter periplasmic adaptor subunit [Acinetobacter sp. Tr-809]USA46606.1 efflux RND transporter periplasmic adaptor subunit [Acinetobacter sp. C26M]USA50090.1 efflux RND transporter periplasmic adaptor subunit [Acinetobacter sp. C26G]